MPAARGCLGSREVTISRQTRTNHHRLVPAFYPPSQLECGIQLPTSQVGSPCLARGAFEGWRCWPPSVLHRSEGSVSDDEIWQFNVGTTTKRPIVVDQYVSGVTVLAPLYSEAIILAAGMCDRPGAEMVMSTTPVV